jgi:DNA-binding response OmpR family regulator
LTSEVRAASSHNKILVIDNDDRVNFEALGTELKRRGFSVEVYHDAMKALANFRPGTFGLILVGPTENAGVSRFEVIRRLREMDGRSRICLMTRLRINSDEFQMMFPDLGVSKVLQKPVTSAEIECIALQANP